MPGSTCAGRMYRGQESEHKTCRNPVTTSRPQAGQDSESPRAWSPGAIAREVEQGTWHTLHYAHPCCPSECPCTFPRPPLVLPTMGLHALEAPSSPREAGTRGHCPDPTQLRESASGLQRSPKFPALSPPLPTGLLISRFVFTAVGTLPTLGFTTPSFIPEMVGAHGCWGHGLPETPSPPSGRQTGCVDGPAPD